jgi:hypothetical protein
MLMSIVVIGLIRVDLVLFVVGFAVVVDDVVGCCLFGLASLIR